jgi:hypothetical protein
MRQDCHMAQKKSGLDDEMDGLYALEPSGFIAARDQLAKRLKADGRAEEAAEVRGLRRPTVAAWAANQVARQQPEELQELLAAGAELRQAQRKVLSGVKGGGFREAMDRRRKAVAALVKLAEEVLREAGKGSAATIDALLPTFEAASVDPEAGDQLKAGRLDRELAAPSGFGGVTGLEVVAAPRETPKPRGKKTEEDAGARAEQEAARREARELEKRAADARRHVIGARAAATRASEKADRLTQEAAKARAVAKQAAATLREAEAEAKRADTAATRAAGRVRS